MSQASKQSGSGKTAQHEGHIITPPGTREKELERVKRAVEQVTDVRQERVEAAKLALKEGRLKLNVDDLAEKILADPLNQMCIEKTSIRISIVDKQFMQWGTYQFRVV